MGSGGKEDLIEESYSIRTRTYSVCILVLRNFHDFGTPDVLPASIIDTRLGDLLSISSKT